MHEYDLIADWYASERGDDTGVPEVQDLASSLSPGSRVLDAGCGNGIPITRTLLDYGHQVVGLDSSSEMLERFCANFPQTTAVSGTIESCPFDDSYFDAAIAWGVMFHLKPDAQITAMGSIGRVLKANAPFLFTSGDVDGFEAKESSMNGVTFRYYSFSIENYRRLLSEQGFSLMDVHADEGKNTYYLATKRG
jgi:ubiquinone/menaquinone biosynthesis C-methylase UbiE